MVIHGDLHKGIIPAGFVPDDSDEKNHHHNATILGGAPMDCAQPLMPRNMAKIILFSARFRPFLSSFTPQKNSNGEAWGGCAMRTECHSEAKAGGLSRVPD